jgi:hypothetical protein
VRIALVVSVVVVVVATVVGGCFDCRPVTTRDLGLECSAASTFRGELHFDSAETWRSFLTDRGLFDASAEQVDAAVAAVDFSREAAFVARGARAGVARCLEVRAVETVDACGDGLRILFDDTQTGSVECPGDWTISLALSRADLRSALDADDAP